VKGAAEAVAMQGGVFQRQAEVAAF